MTDGTGTLGNLASYTVCPPYTGRPVYETAKSLLCTPEPNIPGKMYGI